MTSDVEDSVYSLLQRSSDAHLTEYTGHILILILIIAELRAEWTTRLKSRT